MYDLVCPNLETNIEFVSFLFFFLTYVSMCSCGQTDILFSCREKFHLYRPRRERRKGNKYIKKKINKDWKILRKSGEINKLASWTGSFDKKLKTNKPHTSLGTLRSSISWGYYNLSNYTFKKKLKKNQNYRFYAKIFLVNSFLRSSCTRIPTALVCQILMPEIHKSNIALLKFYAFSVINTC